VGDKQPKRDVGDFPHLVPNLRINGAMFLRPHTLSWPVQG